MTGRWGWADEAVPVERTLTDEEPVRVLPRLDASAVPAPIRVVEQHRPSIDLDRMIEVALVFGGVAFYFAGAAYGAFLLGDWVGAFALAAFGMPPVVYALVKSQQRRVERERRADFVGRQERTNHGVTGAIDVPFGR